ncbi:hypothetical protein G3N62_05640 [Burkholderia sp. Tr-20355]|nr:hypothetical protein [Burkholderia sp. Tr-20355]
MRKPRALKSDSGKIGTPDIRTTYQGNVMLHENKPVVTVRVEHGSGYLMMLHAHVASALPDGAHDLFAAPVLTAAAHDVIAERRRQINVEGFTPERDDEVLADGVLAEAAGSYALHAYSQRCAFTPAWWPWARAWWKPGTPRQMLVKAGALILAAIEQIDRRAAK